MNTDTGQIYTNAKAISAAQKRGELLTELSEEEYEELRPMNRAQRRQRLAELRHERKHAANKAKEISTHVVGP